MLKVGLTGGIGSGKTSVSDMFENLGAPIIDTDIIARELVDNDTDVLQEITDAFGDSILNIDGKLNRKKLAQVVFNVKENKQRLEKILHPEIRNRATNQLQALASKPNPPAYAIVVVPLLIEANYRSLIDRVLVVTADENTRIERVRQRDNRTADEIRSIINNQIDEQKRLNEADEVIENNDDIKSLALQVEKLDKKYRLLFKTNC